MEIAQVKTGIITAARTAFVSEIVDIGSPSGVSTAPKTNGEAGANNCFDAVVLFKRRAATISDNTTELTITENDTGR